METTSDTGWRDGRKTREIEHGRRIAAEAESVWGRDTPAGVLRLERRFSDLQRFFGTSDGKSVLELGCGTGLWTNYLAGTGANVTAIDISEDLLARARAHVTSANVTFAAGDVERLPFDSSSVDFVCGLSILHHLDVAATFREIYRVLKPAGRVWFSEPNMLNPQIMVQKNVPAIKRWAGDTPDETAFFRWPLKRDLMAAGFRNVEVQPFDFLHPAIPTLLTRPARALSGWLEQVALVREFGGSLLVHAEK